MTSEAPRHRTLTGVVVSNKMNKTLVVKVQSNTKHWLYQKPVRKSTKYHVHDEGNSCQEGDVVLIEETRPISKTKAWRLVERLEASRKKG